MILLILILCTTSLLGQSLDIHQSYSDQAKILDYDFDRVEWGSEPPCPWQSVRLMGYFHIQIDIKGNLESIQSIDLGMVSRDLWKFYRGYGRSAMETVRLKQWWLADQSGIFVVDRDYNVRFHTSNRNGYWVDNADAYYPVDCPSPCNGWYMYTLPNGMMYAQKKIDDDLYIVSFVQFLQVAY